MTAGYIHLCYCIRDIFHVLRNWKRNIVPVSFRLAMGAEY